MNSIKCVKCGSLMEDTVNKYNIKGVVIDNVPVKKCSNPECDEMFISNDAMVELLLKVQEAAQKDPNEIIREYISSQNLVSFVKQVRDKKGLQGIDLAKRMNLKPQRVYELESSDTNISIRKAFDLAAALECDINDLYKYIPKGEKTDGIIIRDPWTNKKEG